MPLADDLCPLGFAPHSVRPTRCKRCFRDYNEHKPKNSKNDIKTNKTEKQSEFKLDTSKTDGATSSFSSDEKTAATEASNENTSASAVLRRRRDRENSIDESEDCSTRIRTRGRPHSIAVIDETTSLDTPASPKVPQNSNSVKRSSSISGTSNEETYDNKERRRSRRIQILSAHEVPPDFFTSENSDECSADVAFILQVKETTRLRDGDEEDTVSMAPTDTTETTLTLGDSLEDLQSQVQALKTQLQASEDKFTRLQKETKEWQEKKYQAVDRESLERTATELLKSQSKLHELQTLKEDLKDENNVLKLEIKEIQEELDRRPSPEEVNRTIEELKQKLVVTESLYEELLDENDDFKREIRDLEDEIEELQDNFREDQADEYGVLKKELEQTAKNCRILQFKLRKSEKRCDQLDSDKIQYEDKLKGLIKSGNLDANQSEKLRQMEQEVTIARETSNRMHSEMESLQNRLRQLQEERDTISKKRATETTSTTTTTTTTTTASPVRTASPVAIREPKSEFYFHSKDSLQIDSAQILRDLYDTMERENDLKEQLRFTEEEAENFRKKMSFLEQENETLALQIKKMANSAKRHKDGRQRPSSREGHYDDDSGISDDTDELTAGELKLQLELNEQETTVLRRKVEELEVENISMQKEVRELQEKVDAKPSLIIDLPTRPPADPAQANIFYEQKVKMLENEAKELRMKIIDKDRENERLSSELTVKQRRGSKGPMIRSRSLDSDMQIDLKRQLQLVEQEASILRQKTMELENENDALSAENKMLQLKAGRKGPLTPQQKLQADNLHLTEKIAKLEKNLKDFKETAAANLVSATTDTVGVDTLRKQLKQQEHDMEMLKDKVKTLTQENNRLTDEIKDFTKVRDIKKRKKIPDLAPKQEFKKAVEELEDDVKYLNVAVQSKESENKTLSTELHDKNKLVGKLQEENKENEHKFKQKLEEFTKTNEKLSKSLDEEKHKADKLSDSIRNLSKGKEKDEIEKYKKQIESLNKTLDEEKLKKKSPIGNLGSSNVRFEDLRKVEEEKHKLQKQILDCQRQLSDSEKKITALEHSNKDAEKIQRKLRSEIDDLNSELDKEKNNLRKVDNRQTEVAMGWLKERDEMKKQMTELQKKTETIEKDMSSKDEKIDEYEHKMLDLNKKRDTQHTTLKQREEELKHAKENNNKLKSKLKELEEKFNKVDKDMEELTDKWKKLDALYKRDKDDWTSKLNQHEIDLKAETRKLSKIEDEHDVILRDRDEEVIRLKDKLRKMDLDLKSKNFKIGENGPELEKKLKSLEADLAHEKQEYEDLTSKYEMLEEEHVITKAKLVIEKEDVEKNLSEAQKDREQLEGELRALRETFNLRQDIWIKEKLDLQEKIKELNNKKVKYEGVNVDAELEKLNRLVEEKSQTIDQQKKEGDQMRDDVEKLKRQCQDLRHKLTDFDRSRSAGRYGSDLSPSSQKEMQELKNNSMQAEIEELRTKLQQEEKVHRSELTAVNMMNDVKMAQMQDEIQMLHIQIGKFRRERDTFKEMLDGAQRTIGDLKSDNIRRRGSYIGQETEELKQKLQEMRKLVDTLHDQLDLSERNNSHLKTEYVTEKASWEIKVAEMQTKVNELEENIILQGGKSKIVGVRTKLELAWQKEREEQQRLLHESHRMAKELRQRVIDLENSKDGERTEAKRQLEDLRKTVEADQAETQIKISELQADLLELRDAHSKMRTTNDRIKRERDKAEREKDEVKMKLNQTETYESSSINGLVAELERLKSLVPALLDEKLVLHRKSQNENFNAERIKEEFKTVLNKISRATEELRRAHGVKEEERVRRNLSFRRALSATDQELEAGGKPPVAPVRSRKDDPLSRWQNPQRVTNYPPTPPSMVISPPRPSSYSALHRKSLSLDQSLAWEEIEQSIWKSDSDAGSQGSLQDSNYERSQSSTGDYAFLSVSQSGPSPLPRRRRRVQSSQTSLESISSTGSADKSPPPRPPSPNADAKKNQALMTMTLPKATKDKRSTSNISESSIGGTVRDRLKMFGKSKSIESADSVSSDKSDKPKDFKTKISNIFRKSPSRTNSVESDKGVGVGTSNPLTEKIKALKPVNTSSDPKNKTQYRSTGALHTKVVKKETDSTAVHQTSPPYSATSSLPRHLDVKFHVRSKSMDDKSSKGPYPHETQFLILTPGVRFQETELQLLHNNVAFVAN
uniref:Leucine zipper homeobox-associated domain-containing protein n=1 Tax=Strigamia maritima TaxID=126957 RepID=T1JA69_STRMM